MGVLGDLNHTPVKGSAGSGGKSKTPLKSPRPAPVGVLSPNDDAMERRRSKLARQASETTRREFTDALDDVAEQQRSSAAAATAAAPQSKARSAVLSPDAVLNLYSNCIKLASENKITAKNTWSLALIDHISEIVRDSKDEDGQTNFQKSSCTLDAGVKIYASRVDSFHNETFKMLGGMHKISQVDAGEGDGDGNDADGDTGDGAEGSQPGEDGAEGARSKKSRSTRAVATLEAPETHTVKALEEAEAVDPLFQKTSALFDEGGASGLLLNNLSVHRGCNICFDSEEVPDYTDFADENESPLEGTTVDLSSMRHVIERASRLAAAATRITPTIAVIEDMLAALTGAIAPSTAAAAAATAAAGGGGGGSGTAGISLFDFTSHSQGGEASPGGAQFADYDDDDDDGAAGAGGDDDFGGAALDFGDDDGGGGGGFDNDDDEEEGSFGHHQHARGGEFGAVDMDADTGLEWVIHAGGKNLGGKMAWAGPSHWRFKAAPKAAGIDKGGREEGEEGAAKPKGKRGKGELTFDFENPEEPDEARFTPAATGEELTLVSAPTAADTLLPPDLGYEAKDLARLSLRPGTGVGSGGGGGFGTSSTGASGDGGEFNNPNCEVGGGGLDFDDDDDFGGGGGDGFDDEYDAGSGGDGAGGFNFTGGMEDSQLGADGLVAAPRRVERIRVDYARATKQVDVKELKATLWDSLRDPRVSPADPATGAHSFHALLADFPEDNAAGATEDISVHMAFICMLHLANEHGLSITDRDSLTDLDISGLPTLAAS
mmetsp:Transcript_11270/g.27486  ORF Transcript_11270/g.27486 Transcript_11270/m.27486 type:complete len:774 (-) Transcript_11270:490-2811(-)